MNRNIFFFLLAFALLNGSKTDLFAQSQIKTDEFIPGALWLDTEGHHINAMEEG